MVDRFVALALDPGAPVPAVLPRPRLRADPARARELAHTFGLSADGPVLALCPGAEYGPAKRWPPRHFATVAAEFARHGEVWLIGSAAERDVAAEVCAALPAGAVSAVHDLCGRTGLVDATDLLSLAGQVVCNDSGLMHVACALDRPVIAIYGSTSPSFTPPLATEASVLSLDLACSPCFERECPLGHLRCLNELAPAQVLARLKVA
jgi:heptosyltransferase II